MQRPVQQSLTRGRLTRKVLQQASQTLPRSRLSVHFTAAARVKLGVDRYRVGLTQGQSHIEDGLPLLLE